MKRTATSARVLTRLRQGAAWLPCLAFLVMWPFSSGFYTSFGLDTDRDEEGSVKRTHHRLRWPGDGSFWVGAESFWLPASEPVDAFDLGGTFFQAARRPRPRSSWNRVGFWFIHEESLAPPVPLTSTAHAGAFWVGVPSWLPPLLLGLWPLRPWLRGRRVAKSPESR
ncbi:hypothetical protein [Archangium gephyra]|nr:hypothetical protein [Archangium gephyra]